MTGNEARTLFLEYFKKHDHQIVRSSSLVPADDPTLLFSNAGMVQFKRTFLGEEVRSYNRATTSQKCVRAGGKHNDLENVGYTARHHTFFEMLGNFSFGDYFKEKAIELAWDLLTNGYRLPSDKLWISVYLDDDEAYGIWQKNIGVPDDRIVRFGEKDNFWSMGDTGPCGPCSEIMIDRGEAYGCGRPDCRVGCECDRYLEIWNLVFMQYNRDESGRMTPLPKPSIDTGMGLERIASVIQNVPTNYDTDLLLPIIRMAENLSQKHFGESGPSDIAMKVIADHSRSTAFLIGDGVLPANEGRGYVLRRIMRRAIRYGRNIGLTRPFLHRTVEKVFDIMKPAYPELSEAAAFITNVIKNEEIRFLETLDNGLKLLNETLVEMKSQGRTEVPGQVLFKLYDTFGFPVDIVRDVIRDREWSMDMEGFNSAMQKQREQSRSIATFAKVIDAYKNLSAGGFKPEFVGYDTLSCQAKVMVMVKDGSDVSQAQTGEPVEIVTDRTPFYGEAGGQAGDRGALAGHTGKMEITTTIKDPNGLIIHRGKVVSGHIQKGDSVTLSVDENTRKATALNHTATHILHAVLREVLGDHVKQAGSLVAPDRLRFDFTHFAQVDAATLNSIETQVNAHIRRNVSTHTEEMDAEKAFKSNATALFEEKYGDRVRVISLADFSKELCGGTHTGRTGDIGFFKIIAESSVASGVRRIEAVTSDAAVSFVQQTAGLLQDAARLVREKPESVPQRIDKIISDHKALEKKLVDLQGKIASGSAAPANSIETKTVKGVSLLVQKVAVDSPAALRNMADQFKDKLQSGIIVLGSVSDSKVMLIAVVTKDLTDRFHAGNIVKAAAAVVGGSGGGRPDMAQAGGTKPELLDQALDSVVSLIEKS
ncbi:MAG: alanine--tRNA ligase [Desulfobacterales bacterium]|nr:alanine--tRNA ligase [Desulfobacterales bacterium]